MDRELQHDVVILGAGLAGLRAAVEDVRRLDGKVDIGIVSKVQLMRAHSVCAEGGTAAVLRAEDGDSLELHAWDTVKGTDFLADQDVMRTASSRMMPEGDHAARSLGSRSLVVAPQRPDRPAPLWRAQLPSCYLRR